MEQIDPRWISITEAARRTGYTASGIRRLVNLGEIEALETPIGRLVSVDEIPRLAERRATFGEDYGKRSQSSVLEEAA